MMMREDDDEGKPLAYWVSHNTQLLRCAPHHVRPDFRHHEASNLDGLAEARREGGVQFEVSWCDSIC